MKEYLDCYIRVSTAEQARDGNSLTVQQDIGKKIAESNGMKFRLRNEGAMSSTLKNRTDSTGDKFHYRPVLEQLKDDIVSGKVKNIWCLERSRLYREGIESQIFRRDYIEKHGVTWFEGEYGKKVDFDNANERMIYNVLSELQSYENELRAERSRRGKIEALKRAVKSNKSVYLGGTTLFGYQTQNKEWKINKEEAKWVRQIFQMYDDGNSTKDIKNLLDKNGVKPRRTKSGLWNMVTIQKMLANKTYTGIHHVKVNRDKPNEKIYSFKVDRIITVSQFNRVQALLEKNKKWQDYNKQHDALLGGLLVCECGTSMGSEFKKKTFKDGTEHLTKKYFCSSKNYEWREGIDRGCKNKKTLNMDATDNAMIVRVKEVVLNSNNLKEQAKKEVLGRKNEIEENIISERNRLEEKCQRVQNNIDNIENQIVDLEVEMGLGNKSKSIALKIISRYEEELKTQHEEYKSIENELDSLNDNLVWVDWVGKFSDNLDVSVRTFDKKKEFLNGLVDKIIVNTESGINRKEETVQIGHSFTIKFKMKIVNDKLIWNDENDKRKGYNLKDGSNLLKTGLIQEVTAKAGRNWSKKKQ